MVGTKNENLVVQKLFGNDIELFSSVNELFELELAFLEFNKLSRENFLERTAYTKSFQGNLSKHFLLCSNKVLESQSSLTKSYLENGKFSTGYATHGLFPYRGKFHPQLVKALINILDIEKNELILDPMSGSGTTNVEAALMGINSYAIDVSPFCQFMIKTKFQALEIDLNLLEKLDLNFEKLFDFFRNEDFFSKIEKLQNQEKVKIYNLALLAFLDSLGYSQRVKKSGHRELFAKVLSKYLETVKNFLSNPNFEKVELGKVKILENSDALKIELSENSVDCVITSPPYSFAIDYVENDKGQLELLGYNTKEIKNKMIGLRGKNKNERLKNYFEDMDKFCCEISRVLKRNKFFTLIIGSNTNQTGGIRLEKTLIDSAGSYGMELVKSILKPIKGMRNTMKEEYILIFENKK